MRGAILLISTILVVAAGCGKDPTVFTDAGGIDAPEAGQARLAIDRDQANLGMALLGETTPQAVLTISNTGDAPTGELMASITGDGFRIATNFCAGETLQPGADCEISVVATPSAAGPFGGSLTVTASPGGEVHAALTATGLSPGELMALPPEVDFGQVTAGTVTMSRTIDIKNTGGGETGIVVVQLGGPDAVEFELQVNGCLAMTLAPGATCPVTVRFRPAAMSSGSKSAMITASSTPGGNAVSTLVATVQRPAVLAINGSGAFGGVPVGNTATRTLMVTNTGEQVTGAITITRTGSASFSVLTGMANDCVSGTTTLMPGAMCEVRVQYSASLPGPVVGTITATATPGGSAMASLTGSGQRPARLMGDLTTSFGAIEVMQLSSNQTQWTISNTGDQASPVPTFMADPELSVVANTCLAAIPGNATCSVTFKFRPSAGGPRNATASLSIPGSTAMFTASATGVFRVTLMRNGDAGTVTSNPAGFNCAAPSFSCTALFAPGNVVLQARTTNGSLVYFSGWSGASAGACAAAPTQDCTLTVDGPETIAATFNGLNFNLAFVTSTVQPTNLGSPQAYDQVCNDLATAAGINDGAGTAFIAWMSSPTSNAFTRLGLAAGWVRMDGRVITLTRNNLIVDQRIYNPVRFSELGDDLGDTGLLTGTNADGTTAAAHCSSWTGSGTFAIGNGMGGPGVWSNGGSASCAAGGFRVLCMMKSYVGAPPGVDTTMGKKVWLSNAVYQPDPTGNPDTVCNNDRPAGVAMGRALVSRTTASAASLLNAATMYVRPDGQEVGTGAEILADQARSGIWQSGNGTYWPGPAWTGSATIDQAGTFTSTCGDWTVSATTGRYTIPAFGRRNWGTNLPILGCSNVGANGPRLMCYEP